MHRFQGRWGTSGDTKPPVSLKNPSTLSVEASVGAKGGAARESANADGCAVALGSYSEAPNSLGARHSSKPGTAPRPRFYSHPSDAAQTLLAALRFFFSPPSHFLASRIVGRCSDLFLLLCGGGRIHGPGRLNESHRCVQVLNGKAHAVIYRIEMS